MWLFRTNLRTNLRTNSIFSNNRNLSSHSLFHKPENMVSIHVKKNMLFLIYLLFNAALSCILLLVDNGFAYVSLFILGGHVRDFFNVVIQLVCISKLVKKLPEIPEDTKNTICCLIPIYNEDAELVEKNMISLTTQKLSKGTDVFLMMIFDGLTDKNRNLFGHVEKLISFEKHTAYDKLYENWKSKKDTKLLYKIGFFNGVNVVLAYKTVNSGKKDSLIMGEKFCMEISGIEDIPMDKISMIFHTDGDTASDENCLNELLKSLVHDKDLDGVSGMLRAYGRPSNTTSQKAFVAMQSFQYQFSLIVRRQTESLMNATTCLPGCCNMIRMGEKTDFALEKYTHLPVKEENFLQTIVRKQGTDRRYTTLLLKQGANLQMNWRASVYTEPPLGATSFINQRRRWASNSFFNSVVLLYSKNIPLYIKVSTFIDICKIFSTIFRFFSYFCFWIFLDTFSTLNIIFACFFLAFPYLYSFVWIFFITPEWPSLLAGFFLNKICMPFLSIVSVSKMYCTTTNFAWGALSKPPTKSGRVNSGRTSPIVPVYSKKQGRELEFAEFEDTSDKTFEYCNRGGMVDASSETDNVVPGRRKFQTIYPGLEGIGIEYRENGIFIYHKEDLNRVRPYSLSCSSSDSSESGEEKC